ncbi:MAG: aminotransferase class IV [Marinilabiliaceae bacterium]|nr:aminotransferase class IV [Marinilabiliaceae bacterium]
MKLLLFLQKNFYQKKVKVYKTYLVYDGILFEADTPLLKTSNRAFRFGDGFFETMHFHKGKILFFGAHYERILRAMLALRLSVIGFISSEELYERIMSLAVKNRLFGDALIRLTLFRKDSGIFDAETKQASWLVETFPIEQKGFILNEKGLRIDVFYDFQKPINQLSSFRTLNSEPYTLARMFAYDNNFDDSLIINTSKKIIESTQSNLFWIVGTTVYTPMSATGCIEGILRRQLFKIIPQAKLHIVETEGTTIKELFNADEIFLTNTIEGIRWVVALKDKRFFNNKTKKIFNLLCSDLQNS